MDSIVALDLETTGLDPQRDAIIEIGAVRFDGHRVEGEWKTLVNPGRPVPPPITQLTGISSEMVSGAPSIREVLPDLVRFVGDAPILGQNIAFDLAFLQRYKILADNEVMDTYEMASVLMPTAGRYNLGALGQELGIALPATHRALDDARLTRAVYLTLFEEARQLPLYMLAEIVRLSENLDWKAYWVFRRALRTRTREIVSPDQLAHRYQGPLFNNKYSRPPAPLEPPENPAPIDLEEASAVLEHGGVFSQRFPHFEHRPQQIAMLRAVAESLSLGRHLLVEAGTGTGKSMAYLVPAALWATQNNSRVVISTNTINLQDQLINKDIPDLRQTLDIDLRASVLKGRSNYLCPRRLEALRRRGPQTPEEMRVLAKIMVWLHTTESGDRAEINLNGPVEREIWGRISAEDENCTNEACLKQSTGAICPFHRSRQAADSSHLLIVNHALLLADVATGNRVLPPYTTLIVDEAHHLEDAATNALSYRLTQGEIERMLRELGGPEAGALGWLLEAVKGTLSPSEYAAMHNQVNRITDLAFRFTSQARSFFSTMEQFLIEQREGRPPSTYTQQERILPATRSQPAWMEVEGSWEETNETLTPMVELLTQMVLTLAKFLELLEEEDRELHGSLSSLLRRFLELHENLEAFVFKPNPERIYWVEMQPNTGRIAINAAPLEIGQLMQKHFWYEKTAVILTSATLTAAGEFDYLRHRLQAEEAYELALGSPFDYESSTLLYIANDIPEPNDRHGHQRAIENGVISLCRATGGKALVLFTSYDQLRRTSHAIAPILAKDDITVYEQGEGASAHSLLETFRANGRAVLLGTRAFWEGVDVPGEALSVLVIAKLPFDVPSDPIVAARSETFEDPFKQYSLPEAILRFRQGFGRLIRTQYDRGVVVILDRRVLTKSYGRAFMESLPTCTARTGPLSGLPRMAAQWLNL
jgi:ATP-dependent DNA helicase DinG